MEFQSYTQPLGAGSWHIAKWQNSDCICWHTTPISATFSLIGHGWAHLAKCHANLSTSDDLYIGCVLFNESLPKTMVGYRQIYGDQHFHFIVFTVVVSSGVIMSMCLLPDMKNCSSRMRRECRERFPRHRCQKKSLVSDPSMHQRTCVTHVPWCMSGSLTRGGGETFPDSRRMSIPQVYVSGKRPMNFFFNIFLKYQSCLTLVQCNKTNVLQ